VGGVSLILRKRTRRGNEPPFPQDEITCRAELIVCFQWERYGPDLLLVDVSTGEVAEVVYGMFDWDPFNTQVAQYASAIAPYAQTIQLMKGVTTKYTNNKPMMTAILILFHRL
jgi:hypothetical protein